jgi:hypothetical protein
VGSPARPSDGEVRAWLDDLAAHVDLGPRPNLAAEVRRRLEAESARTPAAHRVRARTPWRARALRVALAGLALVVLLTGALTFSPSARRAVADWLGLRGVRIERGDAPLPVGSRLHLGRRVDLGAARRLAGFDVLTLPERRFGAPDEVYVADTAHGRRVTLVYAPSADLPAAARGVGLLLTQFRADVDADYIRKVVSNGGSIDALTIDGERGYWLGGPHAVWFADADGRFFSDRARLAGDTLLWERGPLTLRLESGLSRDEAVRLAASL